MGLVAAQKVVEQAERGPRPSSPVADHRYAGALLAIALLLTLLFTARSMAPALRPDSIQDDARQHVFWMARFRDPTLFPNDLIADYFQSLAPPGYGALYRLLGLFVEPLVASKLLPPALGLLGTLFTFLFVRRLHPSPLAAFLASVLSSWFVWQAADLVSATPRAFFLPSTAALLWALAAERIALASGLAVLGALFYPVAGAMGVALLGLRLLRFSGWRPRLTSERAAWLAFLVAAVLSIGVVLWSTSASARFGPSVTAAAARAMPEFGPRGRQEFFSADPYKFWIVSDRSGLGASIPDAVFRRVPILFELAALAGLLPLVALLRGRRGLGWDRSRALLLGQLLLVSFGLFVLAHLVLFRLYLPNRFVAVSLPLTLAVAAGVALAVLLEWLVSRVAPTRRGPVAAGLALGLAAGLALYPAAYDGNFIVGARHTAITSYLRQQPVDILVAGMPVDTEALTTLAGRRLLTSREHALPYHPAYYDELRRRTNDSIKAYYAESPAEVAEFASRYGVTLFLVDRGAFDRVTILRRYWKSEPYTSEIERLVRRRDDFALLEAAHRCAVVDDGELALVPASCFQSAS